MPTLAPPVQRLAQPREEDADDDLDPQAQELTWTPASYHAAYEAGVFGEKRVELIEGKVYEKMTMRRPHRICLRAARAAVSEAFAGIPHLLDSQVPLYMDDSELEPDLAVLRGDDVRAIDDNAENVLLVVEISDATLRLDRTVKLRRYARAGYREYWIVNLRQQRLEVYRQPREAGGVWGYGETSTFGRGESVEPLAAPGRAVAVGDLLP